MINEFLNVIVRLVCTPDSFGIGLARIGHDDEKIISGTLEELRTADFGGPLHSFVLVGSTLHYLEKEIFESYRAK